MFAWIVEKLRGFRTLLVAALIACMGVLEVTNWADVIPNGPSKGYVLVGIALVMAVLRAVTTTPLGKK